MQRTAKLTMQPAFGQPTTNQIKKGEVFKTIPIIMEEHRLIKLEGPGNIHALRKIKK